MWEINYYIWGLVLNLLCLVGSFSVAVVGFMFIAACLFVAFMGIKEKIRKASRRIKNDIS